VRLRKDLAKLVALERVSRVATVGRDGQPHVVPVCHVVADGRLYFATGRDSLKVRHLRARPNLALIVDVYAEDWRLLKGVLIQGSAALIERGPRFRKIRDLLYRKYTQYPGESAIGERDSVMVEITPRHVTSWGFGER
ncbi:MAG TPA: pyridoxamine 5'-phosphate oxidase family protein, partial [bacterium]|nr:pyridoxamine 5'-phosphate oxidase family protein [bacterium]